MQNIKTKKLPKSTVEIEGEISATDFEKYFEPTILKLGENVEIDGFRKGKVPRNILESKIPEMHILEEMAQSALGEYYPKILEAEKIDAIGRPEITITKLARNNALGFKIVTATIPEIKLPNYKKLAKDVLGSLTEEEKKTDITDEDVDRTIMDIRKSRAPRKHMSDVSTTDKDNDKEEDLPEFNDDFVKNLGPFEGVDDFKDKLKINLKLEKENHQKEATRIKIIEKIIDESTIEVPEVLIDSEVNKIIQKMESDITMMGLKFEDYLNHINKTIDDLKKEFRADGEKKAKLSLVLYEITKTENIKPNEKEVEVEVNKILENYKDADKERARMHVENVLVNEEIFKLLENQK